ncbi:MAG TPA: MFS transporter [Polyangium sp.]|jgi:MFS family permease|nr:MFS transporter [Polyangium sp.]
MAQLGEESIWRYSFRALKFRNYRLFFAGQSLSLIGTWMTTVASSWLMYRLTHSALLLGIAGFTSQIPMLLVGPFAGVWVDRLNRHRVLVVTQALSMLQSFALATLALTHEITAEHVLALNLFQGIVNAFDMPARQAFLPQMVERREDLPNAIALNSMMVNGSRLVGPSLAGFIIAAFGEAYCFLIDGISYSAVILSLLAMHISPPRTNRVKESMGTELRQGWRYVAGFAPARNILLLLGLVSLVGMPYTVLMPVFASRSLGGGAHTLGLLMAAQGLGAVASAIWLASRKSVLGLVRIIPFVAMLFGVAVVAFGFSRSLPLSLVLLFVSGFGMMQQMSASNTILQTITEEDKRGRLMSYYAIAFQGTMPFGSLLAGWSASRYGPSTTLAVGGTCCVLGAIGFLLRIDDVRRVLRPIYVQLGILPRRK